MAEYQTTPGDPIPQPDPHAEAGRQSAQVDEAWSDVMRSLDELGRSVGSWAGSVQHDPKNRERAEQLKSGLEGVGKQIGDVLDAATKSGFVRELSTAALRTGDVVVDSARRVGDEVAPHVAGAFISIAQGLLSAAQKMTAKAAEATTEAKTSEEPPATAAPAEAAAPAHESHPSAAPYSGAEPPAPAPTGIHEESEEF